MTRKQWIGIAEELRVKLSDDQSMDYWQGVMDSAWIVAEAAHKINPKLARSEFITRVATGHA